MVPATQTIELDDLGDHAEQIAAEVRAGHKLEVLQGGRRIAEIIPCDPEPTEEEREAAWHRLMKLLDTGIDLGGVPPTRDEMHER